MDLESVNPSAPVVVKLGGAVASDLPEAFWASVEVLRADAPVLIVHGGGPQATEVARRLGHEPRIVQGRRVTTAQDLEIVQWTMRGALNVQLVAAAVGRGVPAVGLSGADGGLLRVRKRPPWTIEGEQVDFGWVGDVERVEAGVLAHLFAGGFVPVVAPLGLDAAGRLYNVNADTVAATLGAALGASALFLVTDSGGLRRHADDPASHLAQCDAATYERGLDEGWIGGGMRVKLRVAFEALRAGVGSVYICAPEDLVDRENATRVVLDEMGGG